MTDVAPRTFGLDELPVAGQIGPMPDSLDVPFWDGLATGELRIQRCDGCGTWIWGPQWICHACHSFDLTWTATPMAGTVYSWTRTWQEFSEEYAGLGPVTTLLVELPAAGNVRILGCLIDASEVAIGDSVVGIIQPASELTTGQPILRWRPTAHAEED